MRILRRPEPWVFAILLGSYAYFWQARDWNTASRLMLTYALVDRGTIALNGLEDQTGDKAYFRGRYYTDKLPGFSLLAAGPYALAKGLLRLPDHPLKRPAFAHWPADYWTTLATSGLLTAAAGAVLARLACGFGCGPRRAALVGLAYGLATPAYVYATLAYGHQASAFALLASFALVASGGGRRPTLRMALAGFLASYAAVIELQVGPVAALLGFWLLARVIGRQLPPGALGGFGVGALLPALLLVGYNQLAFGSPWDMGYFHHATALFVKVHSARNPLGLGSPRWERAGALLWGGYRGLTFYAPIVLLALPGWLVLAARGRPGTATVSLGAVLAVFLVNLSYPEWTGGWSTGPRLLVPLLPFAMVAVAATLARNGRVAALIAASLAISGATLMLLFVGAGGRIPQDVADPLGGGVWPLWRGDPLPGWTFGHRFARNALGLLAPGAVARLPESWRWAQFVPLVAGQGAAIVAMAVALGRRGDPGSDLGVDRQ